MTILKTPEWLRQTLAADRMKFSDLADKTGIEPLRLARIFAGTIVGTPEERDTIQRALGLPPITFRFESLDLARRVREAADTYGDHAHCWLVYRVDGDQNMIFTSATIDDAVAGEINTQDGLTCVESTLGKALALLHNQDPKA
jgi:transcriptional regulator with XRE-family HTH domain